MTLEIIGAGFGRTGTESMKRALEMLSFGPCYHMYEVMAQPDRLETWRAVYDGRKDPEWEAIFAGYRATVDWPGARYWRELAAHYPRARILLTYRDSESWYASMEKTILMKARDPERSDGMAYRVCREVFGPALSSKARMIEVYESNIAEVQAAFGPDRLLSYELGSGWAPLCAFLGVAVPPVAFPQGNHSDEFHARNVAASGRHGAPGGAG